MSLDKILLTVADTAIGDRSPNEVIRAVYSGAINLDALAVLLPIQQLPAVPIIDNLRAPELAKVLMLLAVLGKVCGDDAWIHFNIVKQLNGLIASGVSEARLPAIIHSQLGIEGLRDADASSSARAFLQSILSRELAPFAPREAIRQGLRAAQRGHSATLCQSAFSALGLEAPTGRPTIPQVLRIAKELGIKPDDLPNTTSLDRASGLHSVVVEPQHKIKFPSVRGDPSHYIFRPAEQEIKSPSIAVHTLPSGIFSVDATSRGMEQHYVFDRNGDCVLDLANGVDPFIADAVIECDDPVAVLIDHFAGAMNICHFLLDYVTRIPIYQRAVSRPIKFFMVDDYPYYRAVFERLGVADSILFPSGKRVSIRTPELLFSSNVDVDHRHPAHHCAPWAIDYLRGAFGVEGAVRGSRRLFISRADTTGRGLANFDELMPAFHRHGFEVVELSGMTFDAQVALFREASHVVGVHGAGLTNILFAPRDCAVLEILPPLVATRAYWILASAIGQRYSAVIADDATGIPRPDYKTWVHDYLNNGRDIRVPVQRLDAALGRI